MSIEFLVTSCIVVLLPGTGVIYTLAVGLGLGFRGAVAAAFGCTLGIVPAAAAGLLGLAAIFHASALAFSVVKYLGVAYLLYMAWMMWRGGGPLTVEAEKRPLSSVKIATSGMLLNVLNPKLSLFFLAFLPQFVSAESPSATAEMVLLAAIFMLMTFVVFIIYGAFAALARDAIIACPKVVTWLSRSFAAVFATLGLRLAFADR